jgi:hypothetical protein
MPSSRSRHGAATYHLELDVADQDARARTRRDLAVRDRDVPPRETRLERPPELRGRFLERGRRLQRDVAVLAAVVTVADQPASRFGLDAVDRLRRQSTTRRDVDRGDGGLHQFNLNDGRATPRSSTRAGRRSRIEAVPRKVHGRG